VAVHFGDLSCHPFLVHFADNLQQHRNAVPGFGKPSIAWWWMRLAESGTAKGIR
jgi:hypothetical protein